MKIPVVEDARSVAGFIDHDGGVERPEAPLKIVRGVGVSLMRGRGTDDAVPSQ